MQVLRLRDVIKMTGLSRSTLYKLIIKGQFPKQIHLTPRTSGWLSSEIEEWISEKAEGSER